MLYCKWPGLVLLLIGLTAGKLYAQPLTVKQNASTKQLVFSNANLKATLHYQKKAVITELLVNGIEVIQDVSGIYTMQQTSTGNVSSLELRADPKVTIGPNSIQLSGINYGEVEETWTFSADKERINWDIIRKTVRSQNEVESGSPVFLFKNMSLWEGAYQDYGGLAWFYLFNKKLDSYGVNSNEARFWNSKNGNGLTIGVKAPNQAVAMTYSRTNDDKLSYRVSVADDVLRPRYDSGTNRRLFLRGRSDVWQAQELKAGSRRQRITLSYFDTKKEFDRGEMKAVDGEKVKAVLNTIARIGVINRNHFGGNSWHTPYGPICLHEQYIAQFGVGINDNTYLRGYQDCLDYYRDHAIKPDGRVWSRWAYTNEDMMAGEVNDKGFYEAQWGFLLDSNPDLVTNVCELYQQTGNLKWLSSHKASSEKVLDWLMRRDENGNGLVEMLPADQIEGKSSDWIDIVWASYENAFVNAKLYRALMLWSDLEKQLGDNAKAVHYAAFALKLATSFNKDTSAGGFWDPLKKCYVHWRDKGGVAHGNNMVTPVNFMAIAYGISRDILRNKNILDNIEERMEKEGLFFWPLCLDSYKPGELKEWQLPFPNYENGDIFLSWGAVAVEAYATYKPEIAMKYIRKVLDQYGKDGLAFQRYGRKAQDGLGDDILAGNCTSIVGLYQSIYGINPRYNRFYLEPRLTPELNGTVLKYSFRDQLLTIQLRQGSYSVSNGRFSISATTGFGFNAGKGRLEYFHGDSEIAGMTLAATGTDSVEIRIAEWNADRFFWQQLAKPGIKTDCTIAGAKPGQAYTIKAGETVVLTTTADDKGRLSFSYNAKNPKTDFQIEKK